MPRIDDLKYQSCHLPTFAIREALRAANITPKAVTNRTWSRWMMFQEVFVEICPA